MGLLPRAVQAKLYVNPISDSAINYGLNLVSKSPIVFLIASPIFDSPIAIVLWCNLFDFVVELNSRNASNSMNAGNSRDISNSRNARTAGTQATAGTPTTAGTPGIAGNSVIFRNEKDASKSKDTCKMKEIRNTSSRKGARNSRNAMRS